MRGVGRYFIGIIDILMLYTQRKKLENVWKTLAEGVRDPHTEAACASERRGRYSH